MNPLSYPTADWTAQHWSDVLARRVWCFGLGAWLGELGLWLGYKAGEIPPSTTAQVAEISDLEKGISIALHYPTSDRTAKSKPDLWVISQLSFDAKRAPLPFGLDALTETPAKAVAKLGDDIAIFPQHHTVTYYLLDNRVVSVEYLERGHGIAAVHVTRLKGAVRSLD